MPSEDEIVIVTGLPRTGTSMMMDMLRAGGMALLTDDSRLPDENNPRGYFEYEPVRRLRSDVSWLAEARGHAVKIISPLLPCLPISPDWHYRVLLMRRNEDQVVASQRDMMIRRGTWTPGILDARTPDRYASHCEQVENYLESRARFRWMAIAYEMVLDDPLRTATRIAQFLEAELDVAAMAEIPDPRLNRSRIPES